MIALAVIFEKRDQHEGGERRRFPSSRFLSFSVKIDGVYCRSVASLLEAIPF